MRKVSNWKSDLSNPSSENEIPLVVSSRIEILLWTSLGQNKHALYMSENIGLNGGKEQYR